MKGQGWAKRVTLDNLSSFALYLRRAEEDEVRRKKLAEKRKAETAKIHATSPFQGEALTFPNRFPQTPRSTRTSKKRREAAHPASSGGHTELGGNGSLLWRKKMSASDVQKPPKAESKITGCLRLVQAPRDNVKKHNQETWFRRTVFKKANWTVVHRKPFEEHARVSFAITINGNRLPQQELELRYKPDRAAHQDNYTTSLHWGSLIETIRNSVAAGQMFELFAPRQGSDSPFFIEIS